MLLGEKWQEAWKEMHNVLWIFDKLYSSIFNYFKCKEQNGSLTKFHEIEKL